MGNVIVNIETIVEHLSKEMKFLQPVYEAISNSLEAHATNIEITFYKSASLSDEYAKINGFKIVDNGDGFTKKNEDSFNEYLTKNKANLGCKGSGRFTWLKVFDKINITSELGATHEK
jgi:hypothetical protein